ncbi:hypothetical protein D3C81_1953530 [compost metagenome]
MVSRQITTSSTPIQRSVPCHLFSRIIGTSANTRKVAAGPGEFNVEKTRISKGYGVPMDIISAFRIQKASHGGTVRYWTMP